MYGIKDWYINKVLLLLLLLMIYQVQQTHVKMTTLGHQKYVCYRLNIFIYSNIEQRNTFTVIIFNGLENKHNCLY